MPFKRALREAASVVIVGIILGVAYNAVSSRGIDFIRKERQLAWSSDTSKENATTDSPQPLLISIDEAYKIFQDGNALFIDARHDDEFQAGHIKGAISLSLDKLKENPVLVENIPKGKLIVAYCSGVECEQSLDLGQKLASMGFTNVKIFFSGWNDWQQRNFPIETASKENR